MTRTEFSRLQTRQMWWVMAFNRFQEFGLPDNWERTSRGRYLIESLVELLNAIDVLPNEDDNSHVLVRNYFKKRTSWDVFAFIRRWNSTQELRGNKPKITNIQHKYARRNCGNRKRANYGLADLHNWEQRDNPKHASYHYGKKERSAK